MSRTVKATCEAPWIDGIARFSQGFDNGKRAGSDGSMRCGSRDARLPRCCPAVLRRHNCDVQFSADICDRVADGTITDSYRLWSRPQVKIGGIYRSGSVMIEIDEIEL